MQLDPKGANKQVVEMKLPGCSDPEPAEILHTVLQGCELFVPERFKQELNVLVEDITPQMVEAVSRTPAPSLISGILVLPGKFAERRANVQLREGGIIELALPYRGVSLESDILDCWAEALEKSSLIDRYLFDLACTLQETLCEEAPAYVHNSGLWQFMVPSLALDDLSATDYEKRPLLSLMIANAIARSCKREAARGLLEEATAEKFEERRKRLFAQVHDVVMKRLLQAANESVDGLVRSACAKLLIHLGDVPILEKVTGVKELAFIGEPVGAIVLQKLKYLSCLETLDLSESYFPPEGLSHLAHLPLLKKLILRNTPTADTSIANLSSSASIEEIDCSLTQVNDDGARLFLSFRNLKRIKLTGARVSPGMVVVLRVSGLEVSP